MAQASAPLLNLYLFGPFRLERAGQPIALTTRKVEALLAYLALHPEPHAREKLAALFWGDSTDAQARASLRNALPALRKLLGEDELLIERDSIQLKPGSTLWLDVQQFAQATQKGVGDVQALQGAVDLYRGPVLTDFYDDWILSEREHYRQLYLEALLTLIRHYRSRSDYAQAIGCAQRLLAEEPAYEPAHQALMACYQAQGDREAALHQYEICQRALLDDLGVTPSAETVRLYEQIKQAATPTRDAGLTNLPTPLTSFIGRDKEIKELSQALDSDTARLHTLTGPGGAGKTRLAIQAARAVVPQFAEGVWWVELAALNESAYVLQAVAKACGVHEAPAQPLLETLIVHLRLRRVLLVLDNGEHLIQAVAELAGQLLSACPQVHLLATSREALNVMGETLWPVAALDSGASSDSQTLPEAQRLFVERARALQPGFVVDDSNATSLKQICEQLDGLPLAIELAAAQVRVLTLPEIASRLDDRFNLLAGRQRAALPHHQTLRAAIDWSYDLLGSDEQRLLRQLAVFAGGGTLAAIEQVSLGLPANTTLTLLARLVDKSLVLAHQDAHGTRYIFLETIRHYALEKLDEASETARLRQRHLAWGLQLVAEAQTHLSSAAQTTWLDRLEAEHDNLRAALHYCLESDNIQAGLQLAGALWQFWGYRNYMIEGRSWLAQLLARAEANRPELAPLRAKALASAGVLAIRQSDYLAAGSLLQISLDTWRDLEDKPGMAFALHYLGWVANAFGQFAAARERYEESLAIRRTLGEAGRWDVAESLANLGMLAFSEGDYAGARLFEEESLAIKSALGETWGTLFSIWQLGVALVGLGEYAAARERLHEGLTQAHALDEKLLLAYSIEAAAWLVSLTRPEAPTLAPRLWGAAEAIRLAIVSPQPPQWRQRMASVMAGVQARVGEPDFGAAWEAGRKMTMEEALAETLAILR